MNPIDTLTNSAILITGGTGSFGHAFVPMTLAKYNPKRLVIYSRDEMKQWEMAKLYGADKRVRFFIGDVRDKDRLVRALNGIDYVIHAAATKIVPTAEYNPFEVIKTNIVGSQNLIEASLNNNVKKVIALSTDKAVAPINLYGATKLCAEKLFVAANNIKGKKKINFSVVRYGNVFGSRGSVFPEFLSQKEKGALNITDKRMTRFSLLLEQSINVVMFALKNSTAGEIFIPKIPSFRIIDLAKVLAPNSRIIFTGIRPGEKIHEEMITESESLNCFENNNFYVIIPQIDDQLFKKYKNSKFWKINKNSFSYNSFNNKNFLSLKQLNSLIKNYN
jgi:UDP-N-acetylglucosamine 4,6-dehydratase (inverting)